MPSSDRHRKLESWLKLCRSEKLSLTRTSFRVTKAGNLTDNYEATSTLSTSCSKAVHRPAHQTHMFHYAFVMQVRQVLTRGNEDVTAEQDLASI